MTTTPEKTTHETTEGPRVVVIGVGNAYRRDDGVGLLVARRLREAADNKASIVEESGEATSLMEAWKGADVAFVVDAVASGAGPGTVYYFDASSKELPAGMFHNSYSSHDLGVAEAVEIARVLEQLPPRLVVYGIEGRDFDDGEGVTSEVENAAYRVEQAILRYTCSVAEDNRR